MKRLLTLAAVVIVVSCARAQVVNVTVDEVNELSSVVWRLAGADEYNTCSIRDYANDIDASFADFRRHPLIGYCKELRRTQMIGYDAIPAVATFVCRTGDGIGFVEGCTPDDVVACDKRWTAESCGNYVELLDSFYRESRFGEFFTRHKPFYDKVVEAFMPLVESQIDVDWYEKFFGAEFPQMNVFLSPCNGASNYGARNDAPARRRGVVVASMHGTMDAPVFSPGAASVATHEVLHCFTEPLLEEYAGLFDAKTMETFYCYSMLTFARTGVGTVSIPSEVLTRLCTACYYADHPGLGQTAEMQVGSEMQSGFVWMRRSWELLDSLRRAEPGKVFGDFVPAICRDMDEAAADFGTVVDEYEGIKPRIAEVIPAPGSKLELDGDTVAFTIRFSEDMYTGSDGLMLRVDETAGVQPQPRTEWVDSRTLKVCVPGEQARAAGLYGFVLLQFRTCNVYGFPLTGLNTFTYD